MNSFPARVTRTGFVKDVLAEESGKTLFLAGRVIGIIDGEGGQVLGMDLSERGFVLQDQSGKVFLKTEFLPKVGDVLEVLVEGNVVKDFRILAGCEDFFINPGLNSNSPNYKKMVIDERLREVLLKRSQVIAAVREFFSKNAFVETDTPCLVKVPGMEPYLDVFKTRFFSELSSETKYDQDMYLITSPEYAMKKLLVGGMEKVFQITKSFRNKESLSDRHNPEFTILEWYRAFASYLEIMDDTENLVKFLWEKFGERDSAGTLLKLFYKGKEIDLMAKWRRITVLEAFKEFADIDEATFFNLGKLRSVAKLRGYALSDQANFDDCFFTIFLNEIEPKLGEKVPVILYDYPVSMAALSKRCDSDERFSERFEVYVGGLELCNAFTELNDPVEQERRLKQEREERMALGKDLYDIDATFIDALKFGMPPSGGNALGVDRLIMLMLGESDIRNVLYFPMRDL